MKTTTTEKRFSKIQTTTPETWDEVDQLFVENGGKLGNTFAEMLAEMVANSRAILRDMDLPDTPMLWWRKGSDDWKKTPLSFEKCGKFSSIDHYILKTLSRSHDSPEGIAAQIITCAHRVATWEGDSRDKEIFKLGWLCTLYKVYGLESATNTRNSKAGRRRTWAESCADNLVKNNPGLKFPALWEKIPEDYGERFDGFEVVRGEKDGKDGLCANSRANGDDFITKETFRTEYISPAKKT